MLIINFQTIFAMIIIAVLCNRYLFLGCSYFIDTTESFDYSENQMYTGSDHFQRDLP